MEARENKFQISQNEISCMKFSEFYLCFRHNPCEILTFINSIILIQGFCPLKIKITQLWPGGFRLLKFRDFFIPRKSRNLIHDLCN